MSTSGDRSHRTCLARTGAGRVAAADVVASIDVPPFARSAMDGYALLSADTARGTATPVALRIVDRICTGQLSERASNRVPASRDRHWRPAPDGADAVVMVEESSPADDQRVNILAPASPGQNIGRRGADIKVGDAVVKAGDWLNPSRIGALAAIGLSDVAVYGRPRVAILSTGSEVITPGTPLAPGHIYDVNRFTLSAIVAAHGGIPEPRQASLDTLDALTAALDACAGADIIVFSGGSSVGERDLIVDVIAARASSSRCRGEPKADRVRHNRPHAVSACPAIDIMPVERVHPARPFLRTILAFRGTRLKPSTLRSPPASSRPPGVILLHRSPPRRGGCTGLQRLRRDHEPVPGRWIHRDCGGPGDGRRGNGRDGDALLKLEGTEATEITDSQRSNGETEGLLNNLRCFVSPL